MVLRQYQNPAGSPDDTSAIVGEEGLQVLQENGQLIVRTGVGAENADYDIDNVGITDSSDVVLADPEEIGGTSEISGAIASDTGEPFSIHIIWQDENGGELYREQVINNSTDTIIEAVTTKSDHAKVVITDESNQGVANAVSGTLNFH